MNGREDDDCESHRGRRTGTGGEACASTRSRCEEPCAARLTPSCGDEEPCAARAAMNCEEEPDRLREPVEEPEPDEPRRVLRGPGRGRRAGALGKSGRAGALSSASSWRAPGKSCSTPARTRRSRAADADDGDAQRGGFFRRLRDNMSKTRQAIGAELQTTVFQSLDDEAFEKLEETLIYADVGAPTTAKIVERLETEAESGELSGRRGALAPAARAARRHGARGGRHDPAHRAPDRDPRDGRERQRQDHHDREDGVAPPEGARALGAARRRRHLPSGGRGAAHALGRARGCEIVRGEEGSDPGAVVFDAIEAAKARGHDVVLVDTAAPPHPAAPDGRARKVRNVIQRQAPGAPHETRSRSTPPPARTGCARRRCSARRWRPPASHPRSSTAPRRAGSRWRRQELGVPVKLIGNGEGLQAAAPVRPGRLRTGDPGSRERARRRHARGGWGCQSPSRVSRSCPGRCSPPRSTSSW